MGIGQDAERPLTPALLGCAVLGILLRIGLALEILSLDVGQRR